MRIRFAHHVAEDLERERPVVAGVEHGRDHPGDVEHALPWEAPEVTAPLEDVHVENRRVGDLQETDAFTGDAGQGASVVAAREHVESVHGQRHRRVVGAFDEAPRLPDPIDVTSPGEGLVGEGDPVRGGEIADGAQLFGGQLRIVDRRRQRVRARQEGRRAELVHHLELAADAV